MSAGPKAGHSGCWRVDATPAACDGEVHSDSEGPVPTPDCYGEAFYLVPISKATLQKQRVSGRGDGRRQRGVQASRYEGYESRDLTFRFRQTVPCDTPESC